MSNLNSDSKNKKQHSKFSICMMVVTAMIIGLTSAFGVSRINAAENEKNTKTITVTKKWEGDTGKENLRPDNVQINMEIEEKKQKSDFNYAVSVYGIGQDVDENGKVMGLTFGPATGDDYASKSVSHTPSGDTTGDNAIDGQPHAHRCIHDDTWSQIIYWNSVDPDVYEQCIGSGDTLSCTKAVPITMNDTIGSLTQHGNNTMIGDGYSAFTTSELKDEYSIWNPASVESAYNNETYNNTADAWGRTKSGWAGSRVRAVLNGTDDTTDKDVANGVHDGSFGYYGDWTANGPKDRGQVTDISNVTSSNALISCFPEELQQAIGKKAVKADTQWDKTDGSSLKTTYDKLWLFSFSELYPVRTNTVATWQRGNQIYEGVENDYSGSDESHKGMYQRNVALGAQDLGLGNGESQDKARAHWNTWNYIQSKFQIKHGLSRWCWLRSANANNSNNAGNVNENGSLNNNNTFNRGALAPGFCHSGY